MLKCFESFRPSLYTFYKASKGLFGNPSPNFKLENVKNKTKTNCKNRFALLHIFNSLGTKCEIFVTRLVIDRSSWKIQVLKL